MKLYKVYAKCVNMAKDYAIQEITEEQANQLISESVDNLIYNGCGNSEILIDPDDESAFATYISKIYAASLKEFEKYGSFSCGDFEVIRTDEPTRENKYGYDAEDIIKEIEKEYY